MTGGGGPDRLAVFGGTFDPPHVAHLVVAQDVVEALDLDALWFVPARVPPHKQDESFSPGRVRVEMLRAAMDDDARLGVSDVELERDGPSFTVDTLRELGDRLPRTRLHFVLGVDQFAEFGSWKDPGEVARLSRLVVISREGDTPRQVDPGVEVPHELVPVTRIDVSSTEIRRRVREGRSVRYLVPGPVRRIIEREELYQEG